MTVSINKSARAKLLKTNRAATEASLKEQGFTFLSVEGKGAKAEQVWTHADGTTARFGPACDNEAQYIKAEPKARKSRVTYTMDQPVFLASRMKRLLSDVGASAEFDRPNQLWTVSKGKKALGNLTPAELEAISGSALVAMVPAPAAA